MDLTSKPTNFIQFLKGLHHAIKKLWSKVIQESVAAEKGVIAKSYELTNSSSDQAGFSKFETFLRIPNWVNSERDFLRYAILSWYLPDWTRLELQELLRSRATQLKYITIEAYLYSKDLMEWLLWKQTDISYQDLFGNILAEKEAVLKKRSYQRHLELVPRNDYVLLKIRLDKTPKSKVRRRGYNDHGSLADESRRAIRQELENEGAGLQYQIEEERLRCWIRSKIRTEEAILAYEIEKRSW